MPLISSFYGVLIYLYWLDTRQHKLPHIHAMYGGDEAVFGIESGDVLDGQLPRKQTRLVQGWIELRRDELMRDWELAARGEPVFPIKPLAQIREIEDEPTCEVRCSYAITPTQGRVHRRPVEVAGREAVPQLHSVRPALKPGNLQPGTS